MAENRITFTFEINDKGKVKVDGITKSFTSLDTAINKVSADLKKQQTALAGASQGHQSMISDAGLAGATLTELGRTISDANFGIRGMANNLSQLSTLFITLVSKRGGGIGGVTLAFRQLGKQLLGPLGIILAFQSLIALLERYAMSNDKAKEKAEDLTKAFEDQITSLDGLQRTMLGVFGEEKGLLTVGGTRTKALRQEFKEFDKAVKVLEKSGKLNNKTLTETFFEFKRLIEARKTLSELEEELKPKEEGRAKTQKEINAINKERIEILATIFDLEKSLFKQAETGASGRFKGFVELSIEELARIFREGTETDISLVDLFGISADRAAKDDKKFQKWLNDNVPEYIDDVEDFVDTQLLNEGKHTLTEMILGLTPDSRERELKALDDRFDEILHKTNEFEKAKDAINKKWDHIELMANLKHTQAILGNLSDFFDSAAELNRQNKDLARLSIIANGAAASVGIWASYFDLKAPEKGSLALAGTIAAQAALIASTAAALKSLNSSTALSAASAAGGGGAGSEAPIFNVVGASNIDQIGRAVASSRNEPVRAYVVGHEITNQQELDNKIVESASIG